MTVILRSQVAKVAGLIKEHVDKALEETAQDVVDATKDNMYAGHFFYTGLSRDGDTTGPASDAEKARAEAEAGDHVGTVWERVTKYAVRVEVRTPWAADAEYGTPSLAPRPALTPALDECWPKKLYEHVEEKKVP